MKPSTLKIAAIGAAMLAAILFISSCARTPEQKFTRDVEKLRKLNGNVGLATVVVKDNKIVHTEYFGMADREKGIPVGENTLFRIASISKSFTATSLMQLVEKGILSLDTDVSTLAGFPIRNPKYPDTVITLEMLLSHTSSINDNEGYFTLDVIDPSKNGNWEGCYNDYEPGGGYEYCNLNYNLLGSFLEKLSGERFDQYVVHHILDPLGLYGGYCVDSLDTGRFAVLYSADADNGSPDGSLVPVPQAYARRAEQIANYNFGYDTPVFSPTGGMKISAPDLARYMMVHMNYGTSPDGVRLISEEHSRSMQTPRSEEEHYGMALNVRDGSIIPGVKLVGHTGGAYGLRSSMYFSPEGKFGFVVISNGCTTPDATGAKELRNGTMISAYKNFIMSK